MKATTAFLLAFVLPSLAPLPVPAAFGAEAGRQGPIRSPEVLPDRRVTFRLQAPRAAEVVLMGQWPGGRSAMAKDPEGIWGATVGPIEPGVWEYSFQVDGLTMVDPGNPAIKPMRQPRTSILHLPGQPPLVHDFQDVPHGAVHSHTYPSKSLGRPREMAVYTPPAYDREPAARFPALYLQHGSGDNQDTWTVHGKAHWILDNLIARGLAVPMVVVMLDGHAAAPGGAGAGGQDNTALFEHDLLEDAMPFVEARYRLRVEAGSRAIVGLSMGGGQALRIGLNHLDRFAWVGGFSSSAPSRDSLAGPLADPAATSGKLRLLWIGCGKDDFLLRRNEEFVGLLREKGIRHDWHLTAGNHSWPVWRTYLAELAPRLFVNSASF
jgi:enterochelin esterase-like enzyme